MLERARHVRGGVALHRLSKGPLGHGDGARPRQGVLPLVAVEALEETSRGFVAHAFGQARPQRRDDRAEPLAVELDEVAR